MKTFRQEIRNWLKEKKESEQNTDRNNLLEEIIVKINDDSDQYQILYDFVENSKVS